MGHQVPSCRACPEGLQVDGTMVEGMGRTPFDGPGVVDGDGEVRQDEEGALTIF